ncbi:hypothetical protein GCM10009585_20120 [Brevibacterium paucivorans]
MYLTTTRVPGENMEALSSVEKYVRRSNLIKYPYNQEVSVTYIIAQPCVDLKDKACVDECPVDCIYEGARSLYIHPDECVDCGACEPVCPVEAIYYEDDVPEQWAEYYKANVEFFDEIGSPGGAAGVGNTGTDHPIIAALPPQQ